MKKLFLIGLATLTVAPVHASVMHNILLRRIQAKNQQFTIEPNSSVQTGTYDQPIDHFSSDDKRTFKQRYYLSTNYAPVDLARAPVIYYQCGEGNCLDSFGSPYPSAVSFYAKSLGASVIVLEHRYYGKSQPFDTMTGDDLKYLTYEQALEDFVAFQNFATEKFNLHGKWIFIGGSYSGALSAYYRLKHPDLVVGALSSSGVVKTELDYQAYDRETATALPADCLAAVQDVTHQVEQALTDPAKLASIQAKFQASDIKSGLDFLTVLATMVDGAVQYGMQAGFCSTLLTSSDHVQGFADGGAQILGALGMNPVDCTIQGMSSVKASDYAGDVGLRQWTYQSCREFGGFNTPYHDHSQSVVSALLDLQYNLDMCKTLFGLATPPETDRMNHDYYEPLLDPTQASKILYVAGALDPYMPLSITKENGNATNPNTPSVTLSKGSHCSDLFYSEGEGGELAAVHTQFLQLAKQWVGQ